MVIDLCRESSQALFIDINSQRIDPCDSYIYSQIEFKSIDEKRIVDIVAYYQC